MSLTATCSRSVMFIRRNTFYLRRTGLPFSTNVSPADKARAGSHKRWTRRQRKSAWTDGLSWEERLADAVTPLWRLSYEEQLELKQNNQQKILSELSGSLSADLRGVDGNPKTVGLYVGTGRQGNIVCVNADHLLNMPEKHKLVARCYQDFIRLSSLDPCLLFHTGGHWREITVRTNAQGHTMAIVYFHPQKLTAEEVAVHKEELVEYFTRGPGSACQLDSLFFQESTMTRCTHEESPYQLLHGQPHIYEEVLGFKFRISADAFFQVNQAAAQVLYNTVRDLCVPVTEEGASQSKTRGTLLDVCCGTGAIGIIASPRVDRVIGIELVEQAVRDATHNAALNNVENCEFLPGKAEVVLPALMTQLSFGAGVLTAVVNPSRAGLHPRVVRALRKQAAIHRLVYVSCKPDGEAMRNFRELCCAPDQEKKLAGQAFSPTLAVPVDMFPHTPHCELLLLFER
ncbi:tRNA (uracil(54)-C(5))-methyltransferase homolog-B isoform X3 [Girardinichthys multiradiatus]|uniref:tRNA (uracil(54)-C(5))-methyltransferase homolog-B isoform X3 n=1 Tax=Girardinichthys multiradiatus TaxID=208333 RepID=UPI001FAE6563|nr:tRNA (uracil(54)-C(5))-methyltransferase homolog-B isoform X3 [Girardinichthys multiradiatus]